MFEVNYVESLSSTIDFNNVTQNLACLRWILTNWRNAYAADIVTLITEQLDPATCGLAWHMATVSNAFAAQAYNVVARGCMNTTYCRTSGGTTVGRAMTGMWRQAPLLTVTRMVTC